jgi:integrase
VQLTAGRIKEAVEEALDPEADERVGFADFCEDRIERMYDNSATRKNHMTAVAKLRAFLRERRGSGDVPLSPRHVNAELLEEMQAWESEERGNSKNTIHKTMRTLRRMINVAIRDGLFPQSDYPFDDLTLERERTDKTPLTDSGVEALEQLIEKVNGGSTPFASEGLPAHSLRAFLFATYMLGMRWSDVASLEWDSIRDGRVTYQMRKTGAQKDLMIVDPAQEILDWYSSRQDERFVFPLVTRYAHKYDLTDDEGLRSAINDMNRRVNQELKEIAGAAGLDINLSTHIARHTSAQRMIQAGWSLQEIQAALGHSSISTTEHYLRSVRDEELDEKHEDLF